MIIRLGLFLMLALGLAGFGLVAWVSTRPPHSAAAAPPVPVKQRVLVAAHTLQAGSLLRPDDLDTKEILDQDVPKDATPDMPDTRGALIGAMLRHSLSQGQTLLTTDAMRPGDHGFLAAVLAPGMRGISVGVDAVSGTAGLIWPGDRVDLILTENEAHGDRGASAVRVLSDVRVIAIDQQLVEGITANSPATQPPARTVTLEVSDGQAERVAVAQRLGGLSLAVRSATSPRTTPAADASAAQSPIWASDVFPEPHAAPAPLPQAVLHIWPGADDAKDYRF